MPARLQVKPTKINPGRTPGASQFFSLQSRIHRVAKIIDILTRPDCAKIKRRSHAIFRTLSAAWHSIYFPELIATSCSLRWPLLSQGNQLINKNAVGNTEHAMIMRSPSLPLEAAWLKPPPTAPAKALAPHVCAAESARWRRKS